MKLLEVSVIFTSFYVDRNIKKKNNIFSNIIFSKFIRLKYPAVESQEYLNTTSYTNVIVANLTLSLKQNIFNDK